MKVFKLAKAELNKLFQRPAIFLMATFLIVALVLVSLFYSPTLRTDTRINYQGTSLTEIHTSFTEDKPSITGELTALVDSINTYTYKLNNSDDTKLKKLKNMVENAYEGQLLGKFQFELLKADKNINAIRRELNTYKEQIRDLTTFMSEIETDLDFFITTRDRDSLKNFFEKLYTEIPSNTYSYSSSDFVELGNFLIQNRSFKNYVYPITNKLEPIKLDATKVDALVEKYYNNILTNSDSKLSLYNQKIQEFYFAHIDSTKQEDMDALNKLFSEYKSIVLMAKSNLENEFLLLKLDGIKNAKVNTYVTFTKVNMYKTREDITKYSYLLNNDEFDIDYSNNLSFKETASFKPSAFDFTVFAMQILSIIIVVFCLFFGASLIAGEQSGGTMKMLAIRPYTRNKIYGGKILACAIFMIILLLISFVASFVIGLALYGTNIPNILVIFNATKPVVMSPFGVLIIYLLTLILNLIFFISLAMMISVLFRSSTIAVLVSFIAYILTIVLNMTLSTASWFKILPFGHLDLFKYLGGAKVGGSFLEFSLIVDGTFALSFCYVLGMIFLFNLISLIVFRKRNIA